MVLIQEIFLWLWTKETRRGEFINKCRAEIIDIYLKNLTFVAF